MDNDVLALKAVVVAVAFPSDTAVSMRKSRGCRVEFSSYGCVSSALTSVCRRCTKSLKIKIAQTNSLVDMKKLMVTVMGVFSLFRRSTGVEAQTAHQPLHPAA
jgi:hypothetical protein